MKWKIFKISNDAFNIIVSVVPDRILERDERLKIAGFDMKYNSQPLVIQELEPEFLGRFEDDLCLFFFSKKNKDEIKKIMDSQLKILNNKLTEFLEIFYKEKAEKIKKEEEEKIQKEEQSERLGQIASVLRDELLT